MSLETALENAAAAMNRLAAALESTRTPHPSTEPIKQKVSDPSKESTRENAAEGVKAEQAENFEAMTVKEFMEHVKDLASASTLDKSDVVKVLRNALTAAGQDSFHTLPIEARGEVVATLKAELGTMSW